MTPTYCTAFDHRYLPQGLALWRSLRREQPTAVLWVLALDAAAANFLREWAEADLRVVEVGELEQAFPELRAARTNRSAVEYIFTLTPFFPRWLLDRASGLECLIQLDADMAIFSDPRAIVDELGAGSVLLTEHGFPPHLQWMEERGQFNVGVQVYRNDGPAREALRWWADQCQAWCRDVVEPGRYADQGYLAEMASRFPGVVISRHPGINLAPWNWMTHRYDFSTDRLLVDGRPLVVFHFARFHPLGGRRYASGQIEYGIMGLRLRSWIYERYARILDDVAAADPRLRIRPVKRESQVAWRQWLMHGILGSTWYRCGSWWFAGRGGIGRWSAHLLGWWRRQSRRRT